MRKLLLLLGIVLSGTVFGCSSSPEWLTQEPWLAHPQKYDYLQCVEFKKDGAGELTWGDRQVIRHQEKIHYKIRALNTDELLRVEDLARGELGQLNPPSQPKFALDFTGDDKRKWSGILELEEGPFEFEREVPWDGAKEKISYRYRLRFSTCPFGPNSNKSLDYYSHKM